MQQIVFLNTKFNSELNMQRGFCQTSASLHSHLYHSLPLALPSSHFHPHVNKDLAHHRSLYPSFVIKGESCAIIVVKNKMVA